jgi:hypothetical protein
VLVVGIILVTSNLSVNPGPACRLARVRGYVVRGARRCFPYDVAPRGLGGGFLVEPLRFAPQIAQNRFGRDA